MNKNNITEKNGRSFGKLIFNDRDIKQINKQSSKILKNITTLSIIYNSYFTKTIPCLTNLPNKIKVLNVGQNLIFSNCNYLQNSINELNVSCYRSNNLPNSLTLLICNSLSIKKRLPFRINKFRVNYREKIFYFSPFSPN